MPAKKRRQYGTGSVYQRGVDGRWYGKISAGFSATGARRYVTVSASTEAEAKRRLKDKQKQISEHGIPEAGTTRATVKSWADEWLPRHAAKVRPKAYATAASAVRKWIIPTIGHRRLDMLTPGDVRAVAKAIKAADRTGSTARHAHWILREMLRDAILEGHQIPNRVILTEAPATNVNDRDAIPTDDARKLIQSAMDRPLPETARWVAALLNGLRQGECLGLTRDAVDLDRMLLDISWQLQALPYLDPRDKAQGFRVPDNFEARHLTHAYHLTRPKTEQGQRIIPLVPWLAAAFTELLARPVDNPWGLIWTGADQRNGRHRVTPARSSVDREAWHSLQDVAGIKHPTGRHYHLHEARHTTATLLLEQGVDPEVVKAIMGHSSIVTSRAYQHVSQELKRAALSGVGGRLHLGD